MNLLGGSEAALVSVLARYLSAIMSYRSTYGDAGRFSYSHHQNARIPHRSRPEASDRDERREAERHYSYSDRGTQRHRPPHSNSDGRFCQASSREYNCHHAAVSPVYQGALRSLGVASRGSTPVQCAPAAYDNNMRPLVTHQPEESPSIANPLRPPEIASELTSFCLKFQIPPESRPWTLTSQTTADRLCVAFKLPPNVSASAIANKISEFLSRGASSGCHKVALDMHERNGTGIVRLAWQSADNSGSSSSTSSGRDSQYNCLELAYATSVPAGFKAEGLVAGQPMPVLVKFSRPGGELTQEDARMIELALYLGFVLPPPSVPEGNMLLTATRSSWGEPAVIPSLLDSFCDHAFGSGMPFSPFWEPYGPSMAFMRPPMFGYLPSFEEMFEPLRFCPTFGGWPREHQLPSRTGTGLDPLLEYWGCALPQLEESATGRNSNNGRGNFRVQELPEGLPTASENQEPAEDNMVPTRDYSREYYDGFYTGPATWQQQQQRHRGWM